MMSENCPIDSKDLGLIRHIILHSTDQSQVETSSPQSVTAVPVQQAETDEQLMALWLHGRSKHTQRAYLSDIQHFSIFTKKSIREIKLVDNQAFEISLTEQKLEQSSINRTLAAVKSLISFAHRIGYLPFDVGRPVKLTAAKDTLVERILSESVADLYRMYQRYAATAGWRVEVMSSSQTGKGGLKEISALISGERVYNRMKFEAGVHRVQRVPDTEAQGRIHTSAATVAVLLCVAPVGAAGRKNPLIMSPDTHACGHSLTEWLTIYWTWFYQGSDMAQSRVGAVQLMPLPVGECVSGNCEYWLDPNNPAYIVGELEITIPQDTPSDPVQPDREHQLSCGHGNGMAMALSGKLYPVTPLYAGINRQNEQG